MIDTTTQNRISALLADPSLDDGFTIWLTRFRAHTPRSYAKTGLQKAFVAVAGVVELLSGDGAESGDDDEKAERRPGGLTLSVFRNHDLTAQLTIHPASTDCEAFILTRMVRARRDRGCTLELYVDSDRVEQLDIGTLEVKQDPGTTPYRRPMSASHGYVASVFDGLPVRLHTHAKDLLIQHDTPTSGNPFLLPTIVLLVPNQAARDARRVA